MYYALRLLAALLGAALALTLILWVTLIVGPSPLMRKLADQCVMPGIGGALALAVFSFVHMPGRRAKPANLGGIAITALWWFETLVLWIWITLAIHLVGWMLIWGDNGPPFSIYVPELCAVFVAAAVASATSLRIILGYATGGYVMAVICITGCLFILSAPYFLWHISYFGTLPFSMF